VSVYVRRDGTGNLKGVPSPGLIRVSFEHAAVNGVFNAVPHLIARHVEACFHDVRNIIKIKGIIEIFRLNETNKDALKVSKLRIPNDLFIESEPVLSPKFECSTQLDQGLFAEGSRQSVQIPLYMPRIAVAHLYDLLGNCFMIKYSSSSPNGWCDKKASTNSKTSFAGEPQLSVNRVEDLRSPNEVERNPSVSPIQEGLECLFVIFAEPVFHSLDSSNSQHIEFYSRCPASETGQV